MVASLITERSCPVRITECYAPSSGGGGAARLRQTRGPGGSPRRQAREAGGGPPERPGGPRRCPGGVRRPRPRRVGRAGRRTGGGRDGHPVPPLPHQGGPPPAPV